MTTFVITTTHTADLCPTANSKVRARVQEYAPQIPTIAKRLGVDIATGPLLLPAEHRSVMVVEADRIEAVNDFVFETGMMQWQSVQISFAQPQSEVLARLDTVPPPLI